MQMSNRLMREVMDSTDTQEGLAAFIEKRPPVWQGR
jgi:enoyl-CoA hydratase/carnithine racemase